ncbi:MAG: WbqC family protein [Verrucomicrobia subdivision 3 bacterium]|nr:WbqC family protein [Limisphaerales bacterium]
MKTVVISQPMYFPWVGMLEQMRLADVFVYLDDAQFSKGGFFNRVQIKTAEGTPWLTVPLAETKLGQSLNETQMAKHDWRRKQLATLRQAYAAAPHTEEMLGLVKSVFEKEHESLAALSAASVEALAGFFEIIPKVIQWSSALDIEGTGSARVLAICQALGAERYVTGHGAWDYLDHESFEAAGIRVEYLNYEKRAYPQLHGAFTPFVSALDLAANCGHAGREVIASGTVYWKDFAR